MVLPIYASLERIDRSLIEAAKDLYASSRQAFARVTLPLSAPGVVAGTPAHVHPGGGDYVNAFYLGSAQQAMIGNRIQSLYQVERDYPDGGVAFVHDDGHHPADRHRLHPLRRVGGAHGRGGRRGDVMGRAWKWLREHALIIYAGIAIFYTLIPLIVIAVFSFNDPAGKFNFTWQGFTLEHWENVFSLPDLNDAMIRSLELAVVSTLIATALGTLIAIALVRHDFFGRHAANLPDRDPDGDAGGRDRRRAALDVLDLRDLARVYDPPDRTRHVLDQLRRRRRPITADRLDRSLEEAARDLGATPFQTFRLVTLPLLARDRGRRPPGLRTLDGRLRDLELQRRGLRHVPALHLRASQRGIPVEVYSIATILFAVTALAMAFTIWQQRRAERMAAMLPDDEEALPTVTAVGTARS